MRRPLLLASVGTVYTVCSVGMTCEKGKAFGGSRMLTSEMAAIEEYFDKYL